MILMSKILSVFIAAEITGLSCAASPLVVVDLVSKARRVCDV